MAVLAGTDEPSTVVHNIGRAGEHCCTVCFSGNNWDYFQMNMRKIVSLCPHHAVCYSHLCSLLSLCRMLPGTPISLCTENKCMSSYNNMEYYLHLSVRLMRFLKVRIKRKSMLILKENWGFHIVREEHKNRQCILLFICLKINFLDFDLGHQNVFG